MISQSTASVRTAAALLRLFVDNANCQVRNSLIPDYLLDYGIETDRVLVQ